MSNQTSLFTIGQCVACRPFKKEAVDLKKTRTGLVLVGQTAELTELEVVIGNQDDVSFNPLNNTPSFRVGDFAVVRADKYIMPWAKEKYVLPGVEGDFVLVPINEIYAVRRKCDCTKDKGSV